MRPALWTGFDENPNPLMCTPAMYLGSKEQEEVDRLVADVEAKTSVQLLAGVVGKSDSYAEIPWKAFAAGTASASLGVLLWDWLRPGWPDIYSVILRMVIVLGFGAVLSLLAVFVHPLARLFLDRLRADTECRQYAQSVFLEHELFRTQERVGILLLVFLFERRAVLLSDQGIRKRVADHELDGITAVMRPHLSRGRAAHALREGLQALGELLGRKGFVPGAPADEIAERLIQEKGE